MSQTNIYNLNEGTIEIPTEMKDQSINVLSAGAPNSFTLSISREQMPWGMSFEEYALVQIDKLKENFNDFQEEKKKVIKINNARCPLYQFHWKSPQGVLYQVLTMIEQKGNVVILTGSFPSKISPQQYDQALAIFQSFQARKI